MLETLRQRNFALLWTAGLISFSGSWLMIAALPVYIYQRTDSAIASGMVWLVYSVPGLLFGSIGGVFADRWDRKRTMIVVSVLQALLMTPLLLADRDGWLWIAYAAVFFERVLAVFFSPCESALLPQLVDESRLVTANTLNSLNDNLARIVGPAIGGILLAESGLKGAAIGNGLSYVAAAILISRIANARTRAEPGSHAESKTVGLTAFRKEWLEGLHLIWANQLLRGLFLVVGISALADSIISPLIVPFLGKVIGAGNSAFGFILATRGVAGIIGGLIIGRVGRRVAPVQILGWSLVTLGIGYGIVLAFPSIPMILAFQFATGPAMIGWLTTQQSMVQLASEDRYRGRVFGSLGTSWSLMAITGTLFGSVLGSVIGIKPPLVFSAILYVAAGAAVLTWLRSVVAKSREARPLSTAVPSPE